MMFQEVLIVRELLSSFRLLSSQSSSTKNSAFGFVSESLFSLGFDGSVVFWGGRSEIKPSEISPVVYREWHEKHALPE